MRSSKRKFASEEACSPRPHRPLIDLSEDSVGGTFHYRSYENAELVSSKQLTTFSDHRFPLSTPDHISLPQYVDYLRSYVDRFHLEPLIKFGCRVLYVEPLSESGQQYLRHRIKYVDKQHPSKELTFDCSHVAICTGLHVEPNIPTIPGIEHIKGDVFHSAHYKTRSQLAGRNVLIMGCGETAMGMTSTSAQDCLLMILKILRMNL